MASKSHLQFPVIEDWYPNICSEMDDYMVAQKAIVKYLKNENRFDKMLVPGRCFITGIVFGRHGFEDGMGIDTSDVVSMERAKVLTRKDMKSFLSVTTRSGSTYYLDAGKYDKRWYKHYRRRKV